jgi:trans-aconitate methyltransferase
MRDPTHLAPYEAALAAVAPAPSSALDLGTGTGQGAFAIARRFPDARVVGVDLAEAMLAEARRKTPAELAERVRSRTATRRRSRFPTPRSTSSRTRT